MTDNAIRFLLLMLLALVVGTMFGIWAGYDPATLSPRAFVEQHQNAVRGLNVLLPVLGATCIALGLVLAVRTRHDRRARYLLLLAVGCMIAAALITRFGNQPINAIVMTWSAQAPPADWAQLRSRWWQWHVVRLVAGVVALALALLAVLGRNEARRPSPD